MLHPVRAVLVLAALAVSISAAPPSLPEWPFDVLRLKNGVVHRGMLLEEKPSEIRFLIVGRAPGKPTVQVRLAFRTSDIAKIEKLTEPERAILRQRLDDITADSETRKLEKLNLKSVEWLGKKGAGLRYDSEFFSLISDAPEEVVRRAAYRLENAYTAFARFLRPRFTSGPPTVIHVHQTLAGYQKAVPGGTTIKNPAFYEPSANRVVCGTDIQKLGDDLTRFQQAARQALDEIAAEEAKIIRLYGKKPDLAQYLKPYKEMRARITAVSRSNEETFERATRQLFQTLYHEAFHAYVGCFVYPPNGKDRNKSPGELPRWLNEGMAQVFETAIFEAGELRIGHADRVRLEKARDALIHKEFPPLKDVLTAGRKTFVVTHAGKRPESDRAYVATWALASYLMFDRQVLGSSELDEFVKSVNAGKDPMAAFKKMTDQEPTQFEKEFHDWLRRLRPNGSLLELGGK